MKTLFVHDRCGSFGGVEQNGRVPREELDRHSDAAKVVVVPSRWPEPFGRVGIEAMRRGRPVIGVDVGGIPDCLRSGETGMARSLGRAGFERARSVFSHDRHIDQLETLLAGGRLRLRGSTEWQGVAS